MAGTANLLAMNTKYWIDSTYRELRIPNPTAQYFTAQWGVRFIGDALNRAYLSLYPLISRVERSALRKRATLTVVRTAGQLGYIDLPQDFGGWRFGAIGRRRVSLRGVDLETAEQYALGIQTTADIVAIREGGRIVFYSPVVQNGDSVKIIYESSPPVIFLDANMDIATSTFTLASGGMYSSLLGGAIAHSDSDWVGGLVFNTTASEYGFITASTTTSATATKSSGGAMTTGSDKSVVMIRPPAHSPVVANAIQAKACLMIKGKDLSDWESRVAMLSQGGIPHDEIDIEEYSISVFDKD